MAKRGRPKTKTNKEVHCYMDKCDHNNKHGLCILSKIEIDMNGSCEECTWEG